MSGYQHCNKLLPGSVVSNQYNWMSLLGFEHLPCFTANCGCCSGLFLGMLGPKRVTWTVWLHVAVSAGHCTAHGGLAQPSWFLLYNCVGMLLYDCVEGALTWPVVVLCWKWNSCLNRSIAFGKSKISWQTPWKILDVTQQFMAKHPKFMMWVTWSFKTWSWLGYKML